MTAKIAFDAVTLARIPKIINEGAEKTLEAHRKPVTLLSVRLERLTQTLRSRERRRRD